MGDCHSSDPGSNPGPGAYTFYEISRATAVGDKNRQIRRSFQSVQDHRVSPLVENNSPLVENQLDGFEQYLTGQKRRNTKQVLLYAKRYSYILDTLDAHEILTLSSTKRHHIMEALVCLSKYLGCYNRWKEIKEKYQLKWTSNSGMDAVYSMLSSDVSCTSMMAWLKDTCSKLPKAYSNILIYNALTGLRPDEACKSIDLIHSGRDYLNKNGIVLEHIRYPEIFIRNSKKAFISVVNSQIVDIAKDARNCGYNALRSFLKRRSLDMNMAYCRKIHGTFLRMNGIEAELVDLLHGRVPRTVFTRHYFRPDFNREQERILNVLDKLYGEVML